MRILVTGASGFIGAALIRRLAQAGHDVTAMAGTRVGEGARGTTWVRGDLAVADVFSVVPPRVDAVVHLAQARAHRDFPARAREIAAVNVGGTVAVLDYARRAGVGIVVVASSGNVYGPSSTPVAETVAIAPRDFYGATKASAELLTAAYRSSFRTSIVRFFGVYGAGQPADRLFPSLVSAVRTGDPIVMDATGGPRLNPVHRDDAVEALVRLVESGGPECINVAGPDVVSFRDIAEAIGAELGIAPRLCEASRAGTLDLIADISLLRAALPPLPRVRFRYGLRELLGLMEARA